MPKKEEDLFSAELVGSGTVQALVIQLNWLNWLFSWHQKIPMPNANFVKKVFKLSNMAADALKSHADSEHHKQEIKNLQAIRSFF